MLQVALKPFIANMPSGMAQLGRRPGALQRVALVGVKAPALTQPPAPALVAESLPPPGLDAAAGGIGKGSAGSALAATAGLDLQEQQQQWLPAAAEVERLRLFQAYLFKSRAVVKAGPLLKGPSRYGRGRQAKQTKLARWLPDPNPKSLTPPIYKQQLTFVHFFLAF